ncbi:MAG: HAMP domain-containing protein [Myxococcus sp.]|nr:HAMP domain-containing protein [Myxococcus sp.]
MKLAPKLALALLVAGVVPTLLMGWLASSANSAELERTAREQQARGAEDLAASVRADVDRTVEALQLSAGFLPADELTPDELHEALALPLHQVRGVTTLVALDNQGAALSTPVHGAAEGLDAAALQRFADAIPWRQALAAGAAVGPPYARRGVPHVAVAVRLSDQKLVAAEVALIDAAARLEALRARGLEAALVDAAGTPLVELTPQAAGALPALLSQCPPGCTPWAASHAGAQPVLAAVARVTDLDWAVVLTQPLDRVLAPAARVRRYTAYWTLAGVLLALGLSVVLVRDILSPVKKLSASAARLSEGRFDVDLDTSGRDELGDLAKAFSQMVGEVKRRDGEIRQWNDELSSRVEARTNELRAVQDQVARARRLAALSSLGAGIAHELNNPLTAVLGLSSLMRREATDAEDAECLDEVMAQARRMMGIVARLISISDSERGDAHRVPLGDLVQSTLERLAPTLERRGISTAAEGLEAGHAVSGDPMQLQAVVDALVENAVNAMPDGGELRVSLSALGAEVVSLAVSDTGKGIPREVQERIFDPFFTTKPTGADVGLGLTVSHRIVENHHGSIAVKSEVGRGSTFTVVLPAPAAQAHLH